MISHEVDETQTFQTANFEVQHIACRQVSDWSISLGQTGQCITPKYTAD